MWAGLAGPTRTSGGFAEALVDVLDPRSTDGAGQELDRRLLIVVDQFEELFTLCDDTTERWAFIEALCAAAEGPGDGRRPAAAVILGVRADFYDKCAESPRLRGALQDGQVVLGPLSIEEARAAVVKPAKATGLELETGLTDLILRDLVSIGGPYDAVIEAGALPLLAHALRATWEHRAGRMLTGEGYRRVGGIAGAIAMTAEQTFAGLSADGQDAAMRMLLRLVRIGDGTADTRRRVEHAQLVRGLPDPDVAGEALEALTAARLVSVGEHAAEITHEALVISWPRLRMWIDTDRAGHLVRQQAEEAAALWDGRHRDPSFLYTGARLAAAAEWAETADNRSALSPTAAAFLDASLAARAEAGKKERRRTRRLRGLVAALTVLLLLAAATGAFAVHQGSIAGKERDRAQSQRIANVAEQLAPNNPLVASQLALAAYQKSQTPEARGALIDAFTHGSGTRIVRAHAKSIGTLAYSPNGRLLVTGSDDSTAKLWDVTSPYHPRILVTLPLSLPVKSVAFSPDSKILAAGGDDKRVHLWNVNNPARPVLLSILPVRFRYPVFRLAFSPTAPVLAAEGDDASLLWDVADPTRPSRLGSLGAETKGVDSVAFSPDGRMVAIGSDDHTTRLWDVTDPHQLQPIATMTGHTSAVDTVVFSPDGKTLASAGVDQGTLTWDIRNPVQPQLTHKFPTVRAKGLGFVDGGRFLATTSDRASVESVDVWSLDPDNAQIQSVRLDDGAFPWDLTISPDGHHIAAGDSAGNVAIWEYPGSFLFGGTSLSGNVQYAPNGRTIAISGLESRVRLFDVSRSDSPVYLSSFPTNSPPAGLAFDRAGKTLAVGEDGGVTELWNVSNPREPVALSTAVQTGGRLIALSPDGHTLAVSDFANIWLMDVTDPRRPVRLTTLSVPYGAGPDDLEISPDGHVLAAAGLKRTVLLWDIRDRRRPVRLAALDDYTTGVEAVAFAADGKLLATGDSDGSVKLWDITDPRHSRPSGSIVGPSQEQGVYLSFSPSGRILATGGDDGALRLWDVHDPRNPTAYAALRPPTSLSAVFGLTIDSRGSSLVVAGEGSYANSAVWNLSPEQDAQRVCVTLAGDDSSRITPTEWKRYLPDLPYRPPSCPVAK